MLESSKRKIVLLWSKISTFCSKRYSHDKSAKSSARGKGMSWSNEKRTRFNKKFIFRMGIEIIVFQVHSYDNEVIWISERERLPGNRGGTMYVYSIHTLAYRIWRFGDPIIPSRCHEIASVLYSTPVVNCLRLFHWKRNFAAFRIKLTYPLNNFSHEIIFLEI